MEEIVLIQVRGERVLSENRLDRKRQSDQRNQPVNNVKKVRKGAKIGRIRREEREENEKRHKYKSKYLAKSNARKKFEVAPENRLKRDHQQRQANYKGSEKEEEVGRVLIWFFRTLRPRKIPTFFSPIVV